MLLTLRELRREGRLLEKFIQHTVASSAKCRLTTEKPRLAPWRGARTRHLKRWVDRLSTMKAIKGGRGFQAEATAQARAQRGTCSGTARFTCLALELRPSPVDTAAAHSPVGFYTRLSP